MAYLGSTPETQSFTSGTDYFNGDGISVAFTLSRPVASVNDIEVVISNVVQQPSTAYTVSGTTITFTSAPPAGTANVYARYLSTVTQTITPSPGTVGTSQLSPSLTNIPFFGGSTLGAGNATGMKNRIINGGMVIDQRNAGASVTPIGGQYLTDRFRISLSQTAKLTAQQNAGSVTPPTGHTNYLGVTSSSAYTVTSADFFLLSQFIEGYNIADLAWGTANAKTVTLSFWVRSSLTGAFGGALTNGATDRAYPFAYTISTANTWEQKTITVVGDTTGTWDTTNSIGIKVNWSLGTGTDRSGTAGSWVSNSYFSTTGATSVVGTSGATFYITGVQLEEGNAATSFDFRDYGRELAMCQRYCEVIRPSGATTYAQIAIGQSYTATAAQVGYFYQTAKRSQPTVTYDTASKYVLLNASDGAVACSSIQTGRSDVTSLAINAVVGSSTFTAGHANRLLSNNTEIPVTIISAEL